MDSQTARLLDVLDAFPDAALALTKEGICIYANQAAAAVLEMSLDSMVGSSWRESDLTAENTEPFIRNAQVVVDTGRAVTFEIVRSGCVWEIVLSPMDVVDGSPSAVLGIGRDITRAHDELRRVHTLQDASMAATSSYSTEEAAQAVLESLAENMQLLRGSIKVLDDQRLLLSPVASYGFAPAGADTAQAVDLSSSDSLTMESLRRGHMLTHEDAESALGETAELVEDEGLEDARHFVAPLVFRGETVGTFALALRGRRCFSTDELTFFSSVSSIVAQTIAIGRNLDYERLVSDTLQEALLILPARVEGIAFGHLYRAANETPRVGGDFYDLIPVDSHHVAIVMGDVSGKGLTAAGTMAAAKNILRAHLYEGMAPNEVLTQANAFLHRITAEHMFATIFVGSLDPHTGSLVYANGGHPPALIRRADGAVERLDVTGGLIGAFAEASFELSEARLDPDDTLLLFTDGITEARCSSGFFDEAGLVEALPRAPRLPADVPRFVLNEVLACGDGILRDDVAILAIGITGPGRASAPDEVLG